MPHYGTLHDFKFQNDVDDIRGTELYGADNHKLGKIDDVIFDHASGDLKYAVVDTGGWFSHKKFLVPADRIHDFAQDKDAFQVDVGKEQIENKFPRFDEDALRSDEDWKQYDDTCKQLWDEGVVQHRDDRVDLDVTPATVTAGTSSTGVPAQHDITIPMGSLGEEITPDVASAAQKSTSRELEEDIANRDLTPRRIAGKFPEPMQGSQKTHLHLDVAQDRDLDQARVGSSRVPDRVWEDNATGSGGRQREAGMDENIQAQSPVSERESLRSNLAQDVSGTQADDALDEDNELVEVTAPQNAHATRADVGQWHPRMRQFENVLRKNRVDVTASCASCAPARDKAA
jgi:sporulation protein YlmC with PRC-barrel domain